MLENGSILLEELIAYCNGTHNPIKSFSAEEIQTATSNFPSPFSQIGLYGWYGPESSLHQDGLFGWYKGTLDDHSVLIKNYNCKEFRGFEHQAYRDIVISIKMSNHNNVLKLIGCSLEFPSPVLVYEDAEIGPLNPCGDIRLNGSSLSWKMRLKVAKDIANALTYLHTTFNRPIIHRDIKPNNVFLDKDYVAKLTGFSYSITVPEGETHVTDRVMGSVDFIDPVYLTTQSVSEQSDVYGFGVFLLVLLTGRVAYDRSRSEHSDIAIIACKERTFDGIVDSKIREELEEEGVIEEEQKIKLQSVLELALRCTTPNREDRPVMIDVAKELQRIVKTIL